jgi:hypothetical protein
VVVFCVALIVTFNKPDNHDTGTQTESDKGSKEMSVKEKIGFAFHDL